MHETDPSSAFSPASRRAILSGLGFGAVCLGALAYSIGLEPAWVRLRRLKVALAGLPPEFDGLKIGLIADIHHTCHGLPPFLRRAFAMMRLARPDLVAVVGDISDSLPCAAEAAEAVAEIAPPLGIFFVPGNHDYLVWHSRMKPSVYLAEAKFAALEARGLRVLRNRTEFIQRGAKRMPVVGLDDLWSGFLDARAALSGVRSGPAIILVHNPDALPALENAPPSLLLAGHTHGGQVVLPFLGPPIVPVRDKRYIHGLYRTAGHTLYVSCGVGYLRRIRFNCRPEVVLLELIREV